MTREAEESLSVYLDLLARANETMNLTAVRDPEEIRVRHFEDSLRLLDCAEFNNKRVLDIGSGAGFPGLPLKIAEPSIDLTLLDATGKKVDFLRGVARALCLDGVSCVHARAEEYARTAARESFDIVTARGVAALPLLCELCLPLVKRGGLMLAMKETGSEAAPAGVLGGRRLEDFVYTLSTGLEHRVVMIKKLSPTPALYPRSWAQIKKRPLSEQG